jgi:hypothetical protein
MKAAVDVVEHQPRLAVDLEELVVHPTPLDPHVVQGVGELVADHHVCSAQEALQQGVASAADVVQRVDRLDLVDEHAAARIA